MTKNTIGDYMMERWRNRNLEVMGLALAFMIAVVSPLQATTESAFTIRYDGFGPVRVGMTEAAASQALQEKLERAGIASNPDCEYLHASKRWKGVGFMFSRGVVARVDVFEGATATESGVRIGDPISKIRKAYGARVIEGPHKYIPEPQGRYITVKSSDGKYAIRFEADKGRVITYYAGRFPEVAYVEHCL